MLVMMMMIIIIITTEQLQNFVPYKYGLFQVCNCQYLHEIDNKCSNNKFFCFESNVNCDCIKRNLQPFVPCNVPKNTYK